MKHKLLASAVLIILFFGSGLALNLLINQPKPQTPTQYKVEVAFPNLAFDHPDGIYYSGDGSNRLFVVGQMGAIYVFENQ